MDIFNKIIKKIKNIDPLTKMFHFVWIWCTLSFIPVVMGIRGNVIDAETFNHRMLFWLVSTIIGTFLAAIIFIRSIK
jgi:uncharacterized membrane protein